MGESPEVLILQNRMSYLCSVWKGTAVTETQWEGWLNSLNMVGMVLAPPSHSSASNKCKQAVVNGYIQQSLTAWENQFWDGKELCYSICFLLDQ